MLCSRNLHNIVNQLYFNNINFNKWFLHDKTDLIYHLLFFGKKKICTFSTWLGICTFSHLSINIFIRLGGNKFGNQFSFKWGPQSFSFLSLHVKKLLKMQKSHRNKRCNLSPSYSSKVIRVTIGRYRKTKQVIWEGYNLCPWSPKKSDTT